jgi:N-acyl-D-amino-acid deacylase
MIGSDSTGRADYGPLSEGQPHPRAFGTFPRVIGHYVRRRGLLEMSDAIKRMTSLPARKLNFKNRGLIAENYAADIIVFDEDKIGDTATFEEPISYPEGIPIVIVNGVITVEGGKHTGSRAGAFLTQSTDES